MRQARKKITKEVKEEVLRKCDYRCINCGSTDDLEIHHVIPLEIGGNDIPSNMVVLCYDCHKAVTNFQLLLMTAGRPHKSGGRKRMVVDCDDTLDRYFRCVIGKKECQELLGISPKNHLTDNVWYKEYLEKHNIKRFRNNIDIRTATGGIKYGDCVGYVVYQDGRKEEFFWKSEEIVGGRAKDVLSRRFTDTGVQMVNV